MKQRTQLEVVRGIAESKADALAGEVGALMREKEDAQQMLERLTEYVADYSMSGAAPGEPGTRSAFEIQNQHRFVSRLNTALAQQRSQTVRIARRAASKMQIWQRARADVEAVERLITRREKVEVKRSSRLEQRESDAVAARVFNGGTFKNRDAG